MQASNHEHYEFVSAGVFSYREGSASFQCDLTSVSYNYQSVFHHGPWALDGGDINVSFVVKYHIDTYSLHFD